LEAGYAAEAGDDVVADAAGAGGGVGQVDQGVAGLIEGGYGSAGGDGLAGAGLAAEQADGAGVDAPGEAGDGLAVAGVVVQLGGGEGLGEGRPGEPVVALKTVDPLVSFGLLRAVSARVWARTAAARAWAAT